MNSKLRTELLKLIGHDDGVEFGNGYHDDCKAEVDEAEKAIRQAVGEEVLALLPAKDEHSHLTRNYCLDCATRDGYNKALAELRQKIKQWQGGES